MLSYMMRRISCTTFKRMQWYHTSSTTIILPLHHSKVLSFGEYAENVQSSRCCKYFWAWPSIDLNWSVLSIRWLPIADPALRLTNRAVQVMPASPNKVARLRLEMALDQLDSPLDCTKCQPVVWNHFTSTFFILFSYPNTWYRVSILLSSLPIDRPRANGWVCVCVCVVCACMCVLGSSPQPSD